MPGYDSISAVLLKFPLTVAFDLKMALLGPKFAELPHAYSEASTRIYRPPAQPLFSLKR